MTTIPSPLRIETLSRSQMIEIIMTIAGRDAAEPRKFRAWLEGLSQEDLAQHYRIITDYIRNV